MAHAPPFAATQISHGLLEHLTPLGFAQTVALWFAVWLGWQYTCWTTSWFGPRTPRVRALLLTSMLLALAMAAAVPEAFGDRGLAFALCHATPQVGRTGFIVWELGRGHALGANHRRMLGCTSARRARKPPRPSRAPATPAAWARTFTTATPS